MLKDSGLTNNELTDFIMDNWGKYIDALMTKAKYGELLSVSQLFESQAGVLLKNRAELLELYNEVKIMIKK